MYGWTSLTAEQESLIKKTPIDDDNWVEYQDVNLNCKDPNCLSYKNSPGTNWFYHSIYYFLKDVIENATETSCNDFTNQKVKLNIGMGGSWIRLNNSETYYSTARDMARFGLLILNEGVWDKDVILNDTNYFSNSKTPRNK